MIKTAFVAVVLVLYVAMLRREQPKWAVNLVIALMIAGCLAAIAFRVELWPFSHYPMFSNVQSSTLLRPRVYGVAAADQREIPLVGHYLSPLGEPDVVIALRRLSQVEPESMEAAVNALFAHYESRRVEGKHDGPPLEAIRLYNVTWEMNEAAANLASPSQRELVMEVRRTGS